MATESPPPSSNPNFKPQSDSLILFSGPSSFQYQPPSPPSQDHPPPQQTPLFGIFSFKQRPPVRVTTEFDSDSSVFFHKVSSKLFNGLAKLKFTFQNNPKGEIAEPQITLVTKHLAVHYDVEEQNALVKGFLDVGPNLKLKAAHDIKAQQGEVTLAANLSDPDYKFELSSSVPSIGLVSSKFLRCPLPDFLKLVLKVGDPNYKLDGFSFSICQFGEPKATFRFPCGEVSLEEKEDEEVKKVLSMNGIVKGSILNGVCTAVYKDENLNLRYSYKDDEMSFIPSISLPSNAVSFAFKRRFGPSDKLSYWYNLDTNYWSTVYKHTAGKDYKFKAGYDSEVRLGWASLWVGDEGGKAKTAPMKMKVQFMLQVPQDDIKSSALMFRVKKRWDI